MAVLDYTLNELGQPIGLAVPDWTAPPHPSRLAITGRYCRMEPLSAERHADHLFSAYSEAPDAGLWTYLPYGPFRDRDEYRSWVQRARQRDDPLFFAIVSTASGKAIGVSSYLRIDTTNGSIEVGHIVYSPLLQRAPAGTEAMYLLMRQAFGLGYRRYEWKCDALNIQSRTAAARLGFSFEGIFRQAIIYKGRNRDTTWYSVTDQEWPRLQTAFEAWLDPGNFDEAGRQKSRLADLRSAPADEAG
jgi:RimJ/RimL family protein N-acetyltransferase